MHRASRLADANDARGDDDDGGKDERTESSLPTTRPDPPRAAAHPRVVILSAPRGPNFSNTDPYHSNRRKLTGDMNVIAMGYAVDVEPPLSRRRRIPGATT